MIFILILNNFSFKSDWSWQRTTIAITLKYRCPCNWMLIKYWWILQISFRLVLSQTVRKLCRNLQLKTISRGNKKKGICVKNRGSHYFQDYENSSSKRKWNCFPSHDIICTCMVYVHFNYNFECTCLYYLFLYIYGNKTCFINIMMCFASEFACSTCYIFHSI